MANVYLYRMESRMFEIIKLKPMVRYSSNTYLISSNGEFAVVDPSSDYIEAISQYPQIQGKLKYILMTHAHFDHMLTLDDWSKHADEVLVGEKDGPSLSDSHKNCYLGFLGTDEGYSGNYKTVNEGDIFKLGDEEISVISCPGHTPGGVSYKIKNKIFCGDTLFAEGGYGRCDLPGGDISVLEDTLVKLVKILPCDITFYPGHGKTTTINELIYYFM